MVAYEKHWIYDPMCWIGLTQGTLIWVLMSIYLSPEIAWISFACGGLIGFFLWLIALGYRQKKLANKTLNGIA